MAEKWLEQHDPGAYSLERTERGITGTRTFMRWDDHADGIDPGSLPVVGTTKMVDESDAEVNNCICRGYTVTFRGTDPVRVYRFSTNDLSGGGRTGNAVPKDAGARNYSMGLEQVVIDGRFSRFEFESAATGLEYLEQPVNVNILVGTIDIPNANQAMTQEELEVFIETQAAYGKSINDDAFEGYAEGQVRYDGFSGGEYYNADGDLRYAVELHFSTRLIGDNLGALAIAQDDWLYELSEKQGIFLKVKNHPQGNYLYKKKNFAALLAAPVVPP